MEQNHPLLSYFYEISAIPRPSYKEQKIAAHLMEFARIHSLEAVCDASSNVLIRKPASAGYENAPGVVLQGHTDMVCEKNAGTVHDFDKDPIEIVREGDLLRANGTTLGADNGYAVAAMMAILADDSLPHPALECLFTTAEEVGLDGMREFDKTQLKSKFMLNLDSGGEEYATAACAGGVRTNFSRTCERSPVSGEAIRIFVTGLCGGHSGGDIHLGRGNALKICARILSALPDSFRILRMEGGEKDNAIPRECEAVILTENVPASVSAMRAEAVKIAAELTEADAAFRCDLSTQTADGDAFSAEDSAALLALLRILPCGPLSMSAAIPGLVESSSNTAIVRACGDKADVTISSRSSVESRLDDICALAETCGAVTGFAVSHHHRYPGWNFKKNSRLQEIYRNSTRACLGKEGNIVGIHAGLECGLLSKELPEMDILSIGPDMYDIHTPAERMSVSSALRVYDLILHILASIH